MREDFCISAIPTYVRKKPHTLIPTDLFALPRQPLDASSLPKMWGEDGREVLGEACPLVQVYLAYNRAKRIEAAPSVGGGRFSRER